MLKPVSLLALDDTAALLGAAVQQRIAASCGVQDLAQFRMLGGNELASSIASIQARRQAPDSALRMRDDVSTRELVLLIVSAAGPARASVIEIAEEIRQLYDTRHLAEFYSLEALCLLPDLSAGSTPADYGAAYSLLKQLSRGGNSKPFDVVWLLDSMNEERVKFGTLQQSLDTYADAVAGVLTFEPEMSGAPPSRRPRGMEPAFNSFGYAELVFPREIALQRLQPRFAAELLREKILCAGAVTHPRLAAKQFVIGDAFAAPLARIGVDAGQSLFKKFQPKTFVTAKTRDADEVIAAVRAELHTHRDRVQSANLQALANQGEQTFTEVAALLGRTVDETLDRHDYPAAIEMLTALIDPMPDLPAGADVSPRDVVTELNAATSALDTRLRFAPNTAASSAARKRVRELDELLQSQQLAADVLSPVSAAPQLEELTREKNELTRYLPEVLFAEERENSSARNAARDAEAARLSEETAAREQYLRELFAQKPRAEQALREALETRRAYIARQVLWAACGSATVFGIAFIFDVLWPNLGRIASATAIAVGLFGIMSLIRYLSEIAPLLRSARENLQQLLALIETTDKAKNAAHNDELQFEYDVAHRRTSLSVLQRTRELARKTLDALRT
ncbi:MAG TPA: hypothetical protein VF846_10060, partial [Thermoanaerobaculia bacterium]